MREILHTFTFLLLLGVGNSGFSQQALERRIIDLNQDWLYHKIQAGHKQPPEAVHIPHTWNAKDAQEGIPYFRGEGIYSKQFLSEPIWRYKRIFIHFEGVMSEARVSLNGKRVGEHQGGYSAFAFEITPLLNVEGPNTLEVSVSNKENPAILPLVGDFNLYGGIYRSIKLIVTDRVCISPLDFASSGVYLHPKKVNDRQAEVEIVTHLSQGFNQRQPVGLRTTIRSPQGQIVYSEVLPLFIGKGDTVVSQTAVIDTPALWMGRIAPNLYQVTVDIFRDYRRVDRVVEGMGLRNFSVDANRGFSLNGKVLPLKGVSRHQDRQDKGSALEWKDHKEDMALMKEMGVNAIRLAHYQQAKDMYALADSAGMIVWAEIPWVGMPDLLGQGTNGYEPTPDFHQNARQQLVELIRQNFNHPSICFWGIYNEIQNPEDESPKALVKELDSLARIEDPYRLTTAASMLEAEEPLHDITDVIAWNKYFGWYYHPPEEIGVWLDEIHNTYPDWKIGVSEYGAGASIDQHDQELRRPNPFGSPHPEEWQSYYHEIHWKAFQERPYIWGTFVWNMFDFSSHFRREGDHAGMNDKGLVTFDRKVKKDAFYFYKANWQQEPVLYISSRRHIFREEAKTPVKVFSNLSELSLSLNGEEIGSQRPEMGVAKWKQVKLNPGKNHLVVRATQNGITHTDEVIWVLESGWGLQTFAKIFDGLRYLLPSILLLAILTVFAGRNGFKRTKGFENRRKNKWRKRFWRISFFILLALVAVLITVFFYLKQSGMIS
ncbi:MAG: glycoside hydrolase family 2 TIM barrel-domain containing protein [Bacteroidota bacterium]